MKNNSVYREIYKGKLICIEMDDCQGESPREWDNLGTMACWHRQYKLGDIQPRDDMDVFVTQLVMEFWKDIDSNNSEYQEWAEAQEEDGSIETWLDELDMDEIWKLVHKYYIVLPLYLYDHSGITMNTSGFSCPWDSGQVGFIYVSNEKAQKEFPSDDWRDRAVKCLRGEVETYDDYLTGNVFGYCVYDILDSLEWDDEDDLDVDDLEFVDSCWGFYPEHEQRKPDYDYCLREARSVVDFDINKEQEKLWTAHQELHGLEE